MARVEVLGALTLAMWMGCGEPRADTGGEPRPDGILVERFPEVAERVLRQPARVEARGRRLSLTRGSATIDEPPAEELLAETDVPGVVALRLGNGATLRVHEAGALGEIAADHASVHHPRDGGHSFWTVGDGAGFEEWLALDAGCADGDGPVATWQVEHATLTPVPGRPGVHVWVDGQVVAYVTSPEAWTRSGTSLAAELRIEDGGVLALYLEASPEPVLVDPAWVATNLLNDARVSLEGGNTAITVGGLALIAGSSGGANAETYDPVTRVWTRTSPMRRARRQHSVTLLADGRVLVVGGDFSAVASEIYDPNTRAWTDAAATTAARRIHTATLLADGRVLVAGGSVSGTTALATAEIWDPATDTFTAAPPMPSARMWHTATRLLDGRVLLAGGAASGSVLSSAVLYDPATNGWAAAPAMPFGRYRATATLLPDGRVLVAGGSEGLMATTTAQVYDPVTNRWTVAASMANRREVTCALLRPDGTVLLVGGASRVLATDVSTTPTATCERFDPVTNTWSSAPSLLAPRSDHFAAVLGNEVITAGGRGAPALTSELLVDAGGCGDGVLQPGEACDDGNLRDGDCCSAHCAIEPAGVTCRPTAGPCDRAEACDGVNGACPPDGRLPSGTECRAAIDVCDRAESCDGVGASCPADAFLGSDTICRPAISECDQPDRCSGSTTFCDPDRSLPGWCGPAPTGPCDAQDVCMGFEGATAVCMPRFGPAGVTCSAATCIDGVESSESSCTGASDRCPEPTRRACAPYRCGTDRCLTSCATSLECMGGTVCVSGRCVAPTPDAGVDGGMRDAGASDAGMTTMDASPGDASPTDAGVSDASVADADRFDASVRGDGGALDVGPMLDATVDTSDANLAERDAGGRPGAVGCGCSAAGPDRGIALAWLVPFAFLWAARARRRVHVS